MKSSSTGTLLRSVAPLKSELKSEADLPVHFDDVAPSERPPVAVSPLPPVPPPLPPPAPAPTDIVSFGVAPKFRREASVIISMADGSHARHHAGDSLTKLLLSQKDSATAEMVSRAMEDGVE